MQSKIFFLEFISVLGCSFESLACTKVCTRQRETERSGESERNKAAAHLILGQVQLVQCEQINILCPSGCGRLRNVVKFRKKGWTPGKRFPATVKEGQIVVKSFTVKFMFYDT